MNIDWYFVLMVAIRSMLSILVGLLIGAERAKHGSSAGMRTHIVVCLGAALTSMTSVYLYDLLGHSGDLTRISAQVISGIGFRGAGMIILKHSNIIAGLTTAAGVWTTAIIGISIGYGFYSGAIIATICLFVVMTVLAKVEKRSIKTMLFYLEIDDMYKTNEIVELIKQEQKINFEFTTIPPKSKASGHIGLNLTIKNKYEFDVQKVLDMENVVFVEMIE